MPLPQDRGDREYQKFDFDPVEGVQVKIKGITTGTFTISGLKTGDVLEQALTSGAWVEATTGTVAGRSVLSIQNQSGNTNTILWRYDDPGALVFVGYRIEDGGFRNVVFASGASSKVYIKMMSGTGTALIEEISPT